MTKLLEDIRDDFEDTQKGKFLTFIIGNECYALEIKYVIEIVGIQPITEVPCEPDYVKGIMNLRGKIIPIVDVRILFHRQARIYDDRTCIVITEINDISVGLVVDRVTEVIFLADENIVKAPAINEGGYNRFVKKIGKVGEDVKLIIESERLLDSDQIEKVESLFGRNN